MNLFRKALGEIRVVPTVGAIIIAGLIGFLAVNYKDEPNAKLQDGITFEGDGTAVSGRETTEGWLDLSCNKAGEVVVKIVDSDWKVEEEGSFKNSACDDGDLSAGELSVVDIPEELRG